jgi:hypothetical protein
MGELACDFAKASAAERERGAGMKKSKLFAILTDIHFWIPFAVLLLGTALLMSLR